MNNEIKEIISMSADEDIEIKYMNEKGAYVYKNIDIYELLDYITNLQTIEQQYSAILSENAELENKITNLQEKVDQYENPDDMTLFYMWLDEKAKDKMKQLQEDKKDLREGWQQEVYDKDEILHNWYVAQGKIEKAIEYIKENKIEGFDEDGYSDAYYDYIYVRDLLNILEGVDKDE